MQYVIRRIYDDPAESDGYRVLIDRLWPRGVSKEKATLDEWRKEIAPSPELREWFDHKPERFDEFVDRYREELRENPAIDELREAVKGCERVVLLYAAHDPQINHAVVLRDFLQKSR